MPPIPSLNDSFLPKGLTYRHGVVGAGKTAALLTFFFELRASCSRVLLTKPSVDTRHGARIVSRNGLAADPDFLLEPADSLHVLIPLMRESDVLLVDEAQFLTIDHVESLRELAHDGLPVFCYGLRTDFHGRTFTGSLRLWELADRIEAIPAVCRCGRPASFNSHTAGNSAPESQVQIGGDELFRGSCYTCWRTPAVV